MLKPRALKPGARIAVVAPASPFKRDEFDAGIRELKALGFEPVYDDSVFAKGSPPYVAGTPEIRAKAIRSALADPSIDGIIGVRGGYGSAQLLPLLDVDEARRARKPFIGYSDLTALLSFLTMQCGVTAFHGPMLDECLSRGEARYDRASFLNAVTRAEPDGRACARRTRRHAAAAKRAASCSAARSPSSWRRWGPGGRSIRRRASCSCSKKWESVRIVSIAWSRSCARREFSRAHRRSSSAS